MDSTWQMLRKYDRGMVDRYHALFYGNSGFYNFGYWTDHTRTQGEASASLVHKLISMLPGEGGSVLDVACGLGASTRLLAARFDASRVMAINLSPAQLMRARVNAPGCNYGVMDAARLAFGDSTFNRVICVEAAFHFDSREAFLREAFRVLEPGGHLAVSDILIRPDRAMDKAWHFPAENWLADTEEYERRLVATGFVDVAVEDVTHKTWGGCKEFTRSWPASEHKAGRLNRLEYILAVFAMANLRHYWSKVVHAYVIAHARRPEGRSMPLSSQDRV